MIPFIGTSEPRPKMTFRTLCLQAFVDNLPEPTVLLEARSWSDLEPWAHLIPQPTKDVARLSLDRGTDLHGLPVDYLQILLVRPEEPAQNPDGLVLWKPYFLGFETMGWVPRWLVDSAVAMLEPISAERIRLDQMPRVDPKSLAGRWRAKKLTELAKKQRSVMHGVHIAAAWALGERV